MSFLIDKQTLDDLNIFGKRGKNSIYGLFNATRTTGGSRQLEEMFLYPLSDVDAINKRASIIRYFLEHAVTFPFQGEWFDAVEYYLSNTDSRTRLAVEENTLQRRLKGAIGADTDFEQIHKGLLSAIAIVDTLRTFLEEAWQGMQSSPFGADLSKMRELALLPEFDALQAESGQKKLSYEKAAALDNHLRFGCRERFLQLLERIFLLDVYISVAGVAKVKGYVPAEAHPVGGDILNVEEMYHPGIPNAVANSLTIDRKNNVIFLTGANMAGKSTFMKTLGTAVFLAHMGFPVPAKSMRFSVLEGMFTTINLPDNINMGYSHFYAEVLRVKHVATQLGKKNLLVIFDELFRGTNVKDAYDATVAIVQAFARKRECLFVISTHITEAGEALKDKCDNVNYVYFPTVMEGVKPRYTYKLTQGITEDRHGMVIIRNEKLLDRLYDGVKQEQHPKVEGFTADKQTLDDLNILGEYRPASMFSMFNRTHTRGGKRMLEQMLQRPLTDAEAINNRSAIFEYFRELNLTYPISDELYESVDQYFSGAAGGNLFSSLTRVGQLKAMQLIANEKGYPMLHEGVGACLKFLVAVRTLIGKIAAGDVPAAYRATVERAMAILETARLKALLERPDVTGSNWLRIARIDYLLRSDMGEELQELWQIFEGIDLYIAVATVARERGFVRAIAHPFERGKNRIDIREFCHPAIPKAIRNNIRFDADNNVVFLTGANMAGKSTLMKSFSIAVYLAHAGLPVSAEGMEFSVQDGLYTSINVSDNINMGYSHYYAEVLRVKHVAEEVASGKNLVVVFDELFKGTNVKDAHDATVAVTEAFSAYRNCTFVISTHITEAGHVLREKLKNLQFVFVPTLMKGSIPTYLYRLQEGITDDRHGMLIIQNEKILDILEA